MKIANSSSALSSRLLLCLLFLLLAVICVHAQEDSKKSLESHADRSRLSVHSLKTERPRLKKRSSRDKKRRSRIWCKCLGKVVTRRQQCRCPKAPRITPFPTIPPPKPTPMQKSFECQCNNTIAEVKTRNECLSRSRECSVEEIYSTQVENSPTFECMCLSRKVKIRQQCCDCESEKCKCWNNWWQNWEQWGGHPSYSNCNRICRRREC